MTLNLRRNLMTTLLIMLVLVVLTAAGAVAFLAITEYKPRPVETLEIRNNQPANAAGKRRFSCLTWNIGYAGLGKEMDFFYEGGKQVRPSLRETERYLHGIITTLSSLDSVDFMMLQEVDLHSKRSHYINEYEQILRGLPGYGSMVAVNYDCRFVPVPLVHPMGRVHSGIVSLSKWNIASSTRHAYNAFFPWPKRLAFLKRCFSAQRVPLDNGKELVWVNLHNSTFDEQGTLRKAEMAQLQKFLLEEYNKGNYILAGGDWNMNPRGFEPGNIRTGDQTHVIQPLVTPDFLPGWQFVFDPSVPTNRDVNRPYSTGMNTTTLIDFWVASPNIRTASVKTLNSGFEFSDHNPVIFTFQLQ